MDRETLRLSAGNKKVAIFADTHLWSKFKPTQFKFLRNLISAVDLVIINGDFWDYGESSFSEFIESEWRALFPLLKGKSAHYLYGNHDPASHVDQRVDQFSIAQGDECWLQTNQHSFLIRHGHLLAPSGDIAHPQFFGTRRMMSVGNKINLVGVKVAGQLYLNYFAKRNKKMKNFAQSPRNLKENEILVCGHSHLQEKSLKQKFINTGVIRWGRGQYLLIDGEEVALVDDRY